MFLTALFRTMFGRVIAWLAPSVAIWLPSISWRWIARGVGLLILMGGVGWVTWWLVSPSKSQGPMVAVSVVEAQRLAAENKSLKAAVAKADETLSERERENNLAAQYIATLEAEKEALRALSSDPDAPVFSADDPWLRQRR